MLENPAHSGELGLLRKRPNYTFAYLRLQKGDHAITTTDRISESGNAIASVRVFVSILSFEPNDLDLLLVYGS